MEEAQAGSMLWFLKVICKCPVPGFLASHHSTLLQEECAKAIPIPCACWSGIAQAELMVAVHHRHL